MPNSQVWLLLIYPPIPVRHANQPSCTYNILESTLNGNVTDRRMDQIESVDANSSVATVQSGVVLERLDSTLRSEHGLMVPLDLGAKGSCHIGGNVSTNAGGLRLVRYGNLHGSVMGVEAVLADGRVLDCLSPLKKGNSHKIFGGTI